MTFPREQIIEWARDRWLGERGALAFAEGVNFSIDLDELQHILQRAEQAARADEREKCEAACEAVARKYQRVHHASAENIADECVAAIRARSDQ